MLMKAMVATSTLEELLDDLHPHELTGVQLTRNSGGVLAPLVTANLTPDRFAEYAKRTSSEIVRAPECFPKFEHAIFITAHSEAPEYEADNSTGLLGVWQIAGEVLE